MRMGIPIHVWGSGFWIGWGSPLFDDGGGVCLQEEFLEKNPAVISCVVCFISLKKPYFYYVIFYHFTFSKKIFAMNCTFLGHIF